MLADAAVANHEVGASAALQFQPLQRLNEVRQLLLAPDQLLEIGARGLGRLARALDDGLHGLVADVGGHENVNQPRGALDADRFERLKRNLGLAQHIGGQVDHDRRFLELHALAHQARGHVHLFADNAVLAAQRRAKDAAVAVAGGDATRAVEPDDSKLLLEAYREEDGARSVVL